MHINRRDGGIAVLGQAGLVESSYRDVLWNAIALGDESFDHSHRSQIVYRDHRGGWLRKLGNFQTRRQPSLEAQVAFKYRARFKA